MDYFSQLKESHKRPFLKDSGEWKCHVSDLENEYATIKRLSKYLCSHKKSLSFIVFSGIVTEEKENK